MFVIYRFTNAVVAGLVPAIHVFRADEVKKQDLDARHNAEHDAECMALPA
jgi:hypothetical protein